MSWRCRVLVIANVTANSDALLDTLKQRAERSPATFTLLVPATHDGLCRRDIDLPILEGALERWREAELACDGMVGDADPIEAFEETWDPRRFDEIIVSTPPGKGPSWSRHDVPHRIAMRSGLPVVHIVSAPEKHVRHGPPPAHEHSPLGPLAVLGWGGRHDPAPGSGTGSRHDAAPRAPARPAERH